jgi:hypothetical protein
MRSVDFLFFKVNKFSCKPAFTRAARLYIS